MIIKMVDLKFDSSLYREIEKIYLLIDISSNREGDRFNDRLIENQIDIKFSL